MNFVDENVPQDRGEFDCSCPATSDERRWLHRPGCPIYCQRCDLQGHTCGGCGTDVPHGSGTCDDCAKELAGGLPADRSGGD